MAFSTYDYQAPNPEQQFQAPAPELTNVSKKLGKAYLYMALGLLVTAVCSFLFALGLAYWMQAAPDSSAPMVTYLILSVVTLVVMLVVPFSMLRKVGTNRSLWPGFITYSVAMGICLSSFILLGVDFYVFGEAFLISALAFGAVGLWGYYSKKDLNRMWMVLGIAGILILIGTLVSMLTFFFAPEASVLLSLVCMAAILLISLIVAAIDAYNIKKILSQGEGNDNLVLYCAFTMYSDFIMIFIRVLYLLIIFTSRNRN